MGTIYTRKDIRVGWKLESTRRDPSGITSSDPTAALPFDKFKEFEVPESVPEFEEIFPVNSGRNVGNIGSLGYPEVEGTIDSDFQAGCLLYLFFGASADIDTGSYWTHAVTEADTIPSFVTRVEFQHATTDILRDLIGCSIKEIVITARKNELCKISATMVVPKSIIATPEWSAGITNFTDRVFEFKDCDITVFDYNDASDDLKDFNWESIEIRLSQELDMLANLGDNYRGSKISTGKREYEITMFGFPEDNVLFDLRKTHPELYEGTTKLRLTVKFARTEVDTHDFVQLAFSSLYVSSYPLRIPNIDDKDVGAEVVMRNNVSGTCACSIEDDRDESNYDGVDDTP